MLRLSSAHKCQFTILETRDLALESVQLQSESHENPARSRIRDVDASRVTSYLEQKSWFKTLFLAF